MGLFGNSWSVDWSEEIKMQRSGLGAATSRFFWGRCKLDDLIFRGLADDVFHGKQGLRKERNDNKVRILTHMVAAKTIKGECFTSILASFSVTIKPHFLVFFFHSLYLHPVLICLNSKSIFVGMDRI